MALDFISWAAYEQEVFGCFREHFPHADIQKNVHLKGRYSKRMRQIDVLITEQTPAGTVRIVVDAKRHNRKLDVKAVEEFEGFLNDIGIDKGLLISNKGYSRSALKRAFYCPCALELDILDFSELKSWQAFGALPYVGDRAFLVAAPFGWVVDISQRDNSLCTMFRRGIDGETAIREKEFLYVNFWMRRGKNSLTAAALDRLQVEKMKALGLSVEVTRRATVKRKDAKVHLRYVAVKQWNRLEVTGFLEFEDVIFFAVLLTPFEKQNQNIRRLEHLLQTAVAIQLIRDNSALIHSLEVRLAEAKSNKERAELLLDIGHWYRDSKQLLQARQYVEQSVSLDASYLSIKELLYVLLGIGDSAPIPDLLKKLLLLDLSNPTVYNDALNFAHGARLEKKLIALLQSIAADQDCDALGRANCLYYAAQLIGPSDLDAAKAALISAREIFRNVFPPEHEVFKAIRFSLKQCRRSLGGGN